MKEFLTKDDISMIKGYDQSRLKILREFQE